MERFWIRFARSWDVLLHGNPAADIFSGLKVSSGGELGFGVGEEEWGSGERDVLEDLTRRTEGLVDLVVSRFGEPAPNDTQQAAVLESEALPWMGSGREPTASDGVIFGGVGAIERTSLRDVSLWMRQIYTNGDYAYGIRDNPQRERRKRRRPNPPLSTRAANGTVDKGRSASGDRDKTNMRIKVQQDEAAKRRPANRSEESDRPRDARIGMHARSASHDHVSTPDDTATPQTDTSHTNIPPPMVSAVEQALDKATQEADRDAEQEANQAQLVNEDEATSTLGIPDQYMKYLTFGLSTLAKPAPKKRPPDSRKASATTSIKPTQTENNATSYASFVYEDDEGPPTMTQLQPMPDGESLKSKIAMQKRLERQGYFLVGLKGDLNTPPADEDAEATDGSFGNDDGSRIVLRTVQVKVAPKLVDKEDDVEQVQGRPPLPRSSSQSEASQGYQRFRAIIYAHRPFVYCFLFEASTSSLQYTSFYRNLRQDLHPVHKPLLSSTSADKVAQRIEDSQPNPDPSATETASILSRSSKGTISSRTAPATPAPIFDLIYDPRLLTVHTSIPNIPEPGTPAAEGIFSTTKTEPAVPGWTRVDAMNVHSQILNTLASVRKRRTEIERTSKTSRGWWVVWMKVPPSSSSADRTASDADSADMKTLTGTTTPVAARAIPQDLSRIAFLVRRASDSPATTTATSSSRAMSNMFSNMTFGLAGTGRSEEEVTGGASAGWGPQALAGGMGVDARKYVEGLLSLGR